MFDVHSWLAELKLSINNSSSARRCRRLRYSATERLESRQLLTASPLGAEFGVNATTANSQINSSIAMDADGDFVVTWQSSGQDGDSYGIFAQRYNAAGSAQGGEFQVNTFTTNSQRSPSVAMDADGDFVVTWQSYGQDGDADGIYAQRYNALGVPQGGEFRVNSTTANFQTTPSVAMK